MRKGQKHSKETLEKLSTSLKGREVWNTGTKGVMKPNKTSFKKGEHISLETEFKKGGVSIFKGRKHTEEAKEKSRLAHLGQKAWNKGNKSTKDPLKIYSAVIKRKFGITIEEYNRLYANQAGVCAICFCIEKNNKRLSIDHCHITGRIRGLLCGNCNRAIGLLKDNTLFMSRAVEYLMDK